MLIRLAVVIPIVSVSGGFFSKLFGGGSSTNCPIQYKSINTPEPEGGVSQCETHSNSLQQGAPREMTVYFIRHAESEWNKYKNGFWGGNFITKGLGSLFYKDAKLTKEGISQSEDLRSWLEGDKDPKADHKDDRVFLSTGNGLYDKKTLYLTSNLRRAALTLMIVFQHRLQGAEGFKQQGSVAIENVQVLSALQETTTGYDAKTEAERGTRPHLNMAEFECRFKGVDFDNLFKPVCNLGDHVPPINEAGEKFCNWVSHQAEDVGQLVIVGHSEWLFDFFDKFLTVEGKAVQILGPESREGLINDVEKELVKRNAKGKKQKLGNTGLIKFTLKVENGRCQIVPKSTVKLNDAMIQFSGGGE
jgi:broad specificity phosphatase PhoE